MAKKELNTEALAVCDALKVALAMDKDANCVTHGGRLIAKTPVGVVYAVFPLELSSAFKAIDMFNALNGCDKPFTITEDVASSTIKVSRGRRRASLATMPKVTVYAPPMDAIQNDKIAEGFKKELHDFVVDLIPRANDVTSSVIAFNGYEAFWTNRQIAAKLTSATWLPPIFAFVNDIKVVTSLPGEIVGIGGTAHSITFHFDNEMAIQISLADDSSLNYPSVAIPKLFSPDLFGSEYPLTSEFIEALQYVYKFADDVIYISPSHVGTDESPDVGTSVEQSDIPLQLLFFAETIKLGAFRGAEHIVKLSDAAASIGFYTIKGNSRFAFVKVKGNK